MGEILSAKKKIDESKTLIQSRFLPLFSVKIIVWRVLTAQVFCYRDSLLIMLLVILLVIAT